MFLKVFVLLIVVCACALTNSQSICNIEGVGDWIYQSKADIFDNHDGIVEKLPMLNIDSVRIENSVYLNATIDGNFIVISTTPDFREIENRRGEIPISATLVTLCVDEENKIEYILDIKDTNNHVPEFEKDIYEFVFYDATPNEDNLNWNEFEEIAVVDYDFTNKGATFEIEDNDYLEFNGDNGVKDAHNSRRFVAELKLKQAIYAPFDETFTITATDAGEPQLNSTASIHLTVRRSASLSFTQPQYKAHATVNREIIMEDGEITFNNVTNFEDIRFDIAEEYDPFFYLLITDVIQLEFSDLEKPIPISKEDPILRVTIYAEGNEPEINAETVVLLNMEELLNDLENETTTSPFLPPAKALRGFRYWVDVNKTYLVLFSVLTACGVLVFFFVTIRRRNVRIS